MGRTGEKNGSEWPKTKILMVKRGNERWGRVGAWIEEELRFMVSIRRTGRVDEWGRDQVKLIWRFL